MSKKLLPFLLLPLISSCTPSLHTITKQDDSRAECKIFNQNNFVCPESQILQQMKISSCVLSHPYNSPQSFEIACESKPITNDIATNSYNSYNFQPNGEYTIQAPPAVNQSTGDWHDPKIHPEIYKNSTASP